MLMPLPEALTFKMLGQVGLLFRKVFFRSFKVPKKDWARFLKPVRFRDVTFYRDFALDICRPYGAPCYYQSFCYQYVFHNIPQNLASFFHSVYFFPLSILYILWSNHNILLLASFFYFLYSIIINIHNEPTTYNLKTTQNNLKPITTYNNLKITTNSI